MKFTHLVLIKRSPHFIYAANEEDALKYAENFANELIGIVIASEGLEVKQPKMVVRLTPIAPKLIEGPVASDAQPFFDEVLNADVEKILDEELESSIEEATGTNSKP